MGMYPGGNIIRVTPTLSTDAYAAGDVLFTATEIPNAVSSRGGVSKLTAMFILSQDTEDMDTNFIFSEGNTALGTINETADIDDSDIEALNIIGFLDLDASEAAVTHLDKSDIMQVTASEAGESRPFLLKAAEGSTSVYVQAIYRGGGTPSVAADDLDLIFHIEYLG